IYRFLARRTGSPFNKVVLRRLFMSRTNRPPVALSRVLEYGENKGAEAVVTVVGKVTDDKRLYAVREGVKVCALAFSATARARIEKAGGECLSFDQLALQRPTGNNCLLLRGKVTSREAFKHFGPAPGVPHSNTRPYVRSQGRKREMARGRRNSRGFKTASHRRGSSAAPNLAPRNRLVESASVHIGRPSASHAARPHSSASGAPLTRSACVPRAMGGTNDLTASDAAKGQESRRRARTRRFAILLAGHSSPYSQQRYGDYSGMFLSLLRDGGHAQGEKAAGEGEAGERWDVFSVVDGQFPSAQDLEEVEAVVVTGSKHDAHADDPWIVRLCALLQQLHRRQTKILGVCFGHQVLHLHNDTNCYRFPSPCAHPHVPLFYAPAACLAHASHHHPCVLLIMCPTLPASLSSPARPPMSAMQVVGRALGGRTGRAAVGWELGIKPVHCTADVASLPYAAGLPSSFKILEIHQDQVLELPPEAVLLGSSPRTPIEIHHQLPAMARGARASPLLWAAVAALVLLGSTAAAAAEEGDHTFSASVVKLTDANFKRKTKGHTFVMFYAEWCGHCKRLIPVWSQLADELKEAGRADVSMASLLATEHRAHPAAKLVRGFPTLIWFHGARPVAQYEGDRSRESLLAFIEEQAQLGEAELAEGARRLEEEARRAEEEAQRAEEGKGAEPTFSGSVVELTDGNFQEKTRGHTFVMFHAEWCGHCKRLIPTWSQLADELQQAGRAGVGVAALLATQHQKHPAVGFIQGFPTLLWFHGGQMVAEYSGDRSIASLRAFVEEQGALQGAALARAKKDMKAAVERKIRERQDEQQRAAQEQRRIETEFAARVPEISLSDPSRVEGQAVVVLHYADWCHACGSMKTVLLDLLADPPVEGLVVGRFKDPQAGLLAAGNTLRNGQPTTFFVSGGRIVDALQGVKKGEEVREWVRELGELSEEEVEERGMEWREGAEEEVERLQREEREKIQEEANVDQPPFASAPASARIGDARTNHRRASLASAHCTPTRFEQRGVAMGSITADGDHLHVRVPNVPAIVAKSFHDRVADTQSLLSHVGRQAKAMAERSTARERVMAAVAALLAVALVAFSVALSLRPPPSIVDAPLLLDTLSGIQDITWRGYADYEMRISPLSRHVSRPYLPFQPIARGPHGFIQFSAYRLSARSFAIVGFGAHFLKDHLGALKCVWAEGGNASSTGSKGEVKAVYGGLNGWETYDAVLMKCDFEAATGTMGGDLFLTVASEEFRAFREEEGEEHVIDPPREDALPHTLAVCAVRLANPVQPRPMYEWLSYHWHVGVSLFRLYDAGSMDAHLAAVLDPWLANQTAQVIPTRHLAPFRMEHDAHALSALDCLHSTAFLARWVTVLSPDSYLFVPPPASILEYLKQHEERSWVTIGTQEWSPVKCRDGLRMQPPGVWEGRREAAPFAVEWLAFRRKDAQCSDEGAEKETCIGEAGQRSHFTNPRKAGILGYYDVRETDGNGQHAGFREVHRNWYPSLHHLAVFNSTCSEVVGDDEFAEGWVRDVSFADYVKSVRKSPSPQGSTEAPPPPAEN
ncbi:unnamed protein product, partial [Closterium sp. NIES-64]